MKSAIFAILIFVTCIQVGIASVCSSGGGEYVGTGATSTAVDGNSNVYVVGSILPRFYLGGNNFTVDISGKTFGGVGKGLNRTGFIAKYNANTQRNVFVKLVNFTSPPEDQPSLSIQSIVARNNRIFISGIVSGSANLFGCQISASANKGGIFIARLDTNAVCQKAIVVDNVETVPFLLLDNNSNRVYLYVSIFGPVTFGSSVFQDPNGFAGYIAQLSFSLSFDWVVRIGNPSNGVYEELTIVTDLAQDNTYVYTFLQVQGTLEFCTEVHCSQTILPASSKVFVRVEKSDGAASVVVTQQSNATDYYPSNIGSYSAGTTTDLYIGGVGKQAIVTKYNQNGNIQWTTLIPNQCCEEYRRLQGYTTAIRTDDVGNVYVGGATDTGTGARFSISQPFIAKLRRTTGRVIFNTRADRDVAQPPSPYTSTAGMVVDSEEGEVYLVGDFGCTLKFGTTVFNSSAIGCAPAGATNGRYTYMFLISVDASSGAPCS